MQRALLIILSAALFGIYGLPCAALPLEKRYVFNNTDLLTQSEHEELNNRARAISEKHQLNVGFYLSKRDYAPDETLYGYVWNFYEENLGKESNGFMCAYDLNRKSWVMYYNNFRTRTVVPQEKKDDFWKVFQSDGHWTTYYNGISDYLDAVDSYLTKVKAQRQLKQITFAHNFIFEYVGYIAGILFLLLIAMTILSKLWSIPKKRFISIGVQKRRNNYRTMTMLALFPCMVFFLSMLTSLIYTSIRYNENIDTSLIELKSVIIGFLFCLVWLVVAYRVHEKLIRAATGAKSLERRDNMRVYNLVENLCMAVNMPMPKIDVIEDNSLNAFASGINIKTYTITLSRGLIDKLDDSELEAVIAHELTHIKNNDAKVMIVSIIFVGIFSFLGQASILLLLSKFIWRSKALPVAIFIIMFGLFVIIPGYLITLLMRSSISRKREYMADAGGAEMTRNPLALAAALRKISADPHIEAVERKDVAQLFIHNPRVQKEKSKGLFATHPPIEKRIQILEQF